MYCDFFNSTWLMNYVRRKDEQETVPARSYISEHSFVKKRSLHKTTKFDIRLYDVPNCK